jgi:hypothetical protein
MMGTERRLLVVERLAAKRYPAPRLDPQLRAWLASLSFEEVDRLEAFSRAWPLEAGDIPGPVLLAAAKGQLP